MSTDSAELLALALALATEDVDTDGAVAALVKAAGGSVTGLMGAYARALTLARDLPLDATSDRVLDMITTALQVSVRQGEGHQADESDSLLRQIIDNSGSASVTPGAVAARTAEVDADVVSLRPVEEATFTPAADGGPDDAGDPAG